MSCLCPRFCLPYQLLPPSHRRLPRRQRLPVHPPSPPRPLRFLQVPAPYSIPRLVPSYDPVIFHLHTLAYHTVETPSWYSFSPRRRVSRRGSVSASPALDRIFCTRREPPRPPASGEPA